MKLRAPSILTQLIILVLFIMISSAGFYRYFFMESFQDYRSRVAALEFDTQINNLYQDYRANIDSSAATEFRSDVEAILMNEKQRSLASKFFQRELGLYSVFILTFIIVITFLFAILSVKAITRPIARLQEATRELSQGNLSVKVRPSRYSPLNDLIHSFNGMVKELAVNRNKLVQAEKDAAWRDVARVMAHEIKNPLTPIQLTTERMEYKYLQSTDSLAKIFPESIRVIKEEVSNLKKLTVEFSQFARLPKSQYSSFELNSFIREIVVPYCDQADLQLELDSHIDEIVADKFQLKQVLVNLIQNGIQACEEDAKLRVQTTLHQSEIKIEISDTGKGIRPDDLPKIFDPYFSKREKGTGLGLAIVKRIIDQHSGNIDVRSEVGQGTTFTLVIPELDATIDEFS